MFIIFFLAHILSNTEKVYNSYPFLIHNFNLYTDYDRDINSKGPVEDFDNENSFLTLSLRKTSPVEVARLLVNCESGK